MNKSKVPVIWLAVFALLFVQACGFLSIEAPNVQIMPRNRQVTPVPPVAQPAAPPANLPPAVPVPQDLASPGLIDAYQGALVQVYEYVGPSVVNIRVDQRQQLLLPPDHPNAGTPTPEEEEGDLDDFFSEQGEGSGFVWDHEGHIVTNNHVIEGGDRILVTFSDGTTAIAEVVGTDPYTDLAVLKVDVPVDLLRPVSMADSNLVKVGQLAIAIGNPFGLHGTMTVGIVSALARSLPVESGTISMTGYRIPDIIQTDAPINPGNSGGVLVNGQGEVIGVTAAIQSPVRANAGIGFAIPAAIVQKVVPSLIQSGAYQHPWIGFSGRPMTPEQALAMNLAPEQRGALVIEVIENSPAQRAGLRGSTQAARIDGMETRVGGDVIVSINGDPIREMSDVIAYLARNTSVGETIQLGILRDGNLITVDLTLAARPSLGG